MRTDKPHPLKNKIFKIFKNFEVLGPLPRFIPPVPNTYKWPLFVTGLTTTTR